MSSPDLTSEMAYFLQDNTVEYLKGATEDELIEFVNTLLPHVSPVGVNRIYPLVSDSFPTQYDDIDCHPDYDAETDSIKQDEPILNYGGTNGD